MALFGWVGRMGRQWTGLLLALTISGCAVYKPTELHRGRAIFDEKSTVGVVIMLPERPNVFELDPERGGGGNMGLIQLGIISAITSKLTAHAKELPLEDFKPLQGELVKSLAKKGLEAKLIAPETIKEFKADRFDAKDGSFHNKDMRPLRSRLGVDRLLAVHIEAAGFNYPFAGVIPIAAGDPMAWVQGNAYLLDLRTNGFQWYKKVRALRGVGKAWDEPPKYPALTAKYFEVIEVAKDDIVEDLMR